MKPRTVYEKAVQDFTETARRLARLDQHFRQTSFAEFKMLMAFDAFDDEALKRYGLSKPMVERVLLKVYQTVVLARPSASTIRTASMPHHRMPRTPSAF